MKIAISAESTIDLSKEQLQHYNISTIPFLVTLGDRSAPDGDITPKEIFEFVEKTDTLPKTSAINSYQYGEYFKEILKSGYDAIIHVSLSSKISSSYQNAFIASQEFENVRIIDSKSLSSGIALLAIYAKELVDKNELSLDEIVEKVNGRVPYVQASFVLAKLDYLYKGGRCSALAHIGAKILGIRPQILVTDGSMAPGKKYRGKDNIVVKKYCEDTLEIFNNPDKSICFVTATNYSPEVFELAENICKEAGFKNIIRCTAGATITSHCGDRTLGILYFNDGDQK